MIREWQEFENLKNKVDQHEKTITQLIEMIAATNRQLHELTKQKKHANNLPLLYHSSHK